MLLAAVFGALALLLTGTAPAPATLVAAGDIASCSSPGDERTAALVARVPGTVATLGDTAYELGTADEFARCYTPSWGRFRARTRPALGNHDYGTAGAAGYFDYFGPRAGPRRGYYSYRLGAWHVAVLNSNCPLAGGCERGSPQERWLRADLASHPARCTLAYWHHPRFSSGLHGDDDTVAPLWQALYDARADVVLAGHDHDYERFAPLDPAGRVDRARGLREFVVGTGGRSHYPLLERRAGSVAADWRTYGILRLTLRQASYDWRFVSEPASTFSDAGVRARCH